MKHLLPLLALCAAPLVAQDEAFDEAQFAPAPELAAYDGLLGHWTGTGTVRMAQDADPAPWTARIAFERALGGHVVEETMIVDVEGLGDLTFRTWWSFDREAQVHRAVGLSSMGPGSDRTVHWPDAQHLLIADTRVEGKQVLSDRTVWTIRDGELWISGTRAVGAGEPYTHVSGRFTRATEDESATVDAAATAPETLKGEMSRLAPMVGAWKLDGKMMPMPGMPEVPLEGTETITIGPGGTHTVHHIQGSAGDGPIYEAWAGTYWDPVARSYRLVMVDNMGGIDASTGRFVDDTTVVFSSAGTMMGTPKLARSTMHLADGGITRVTGDIFYGDADAVRNFDATYSRVR